MDFPFRINSFEEYQAVYRQSVAQPEAFWASVADNFVWRKKWNNILQWNFKEPDIKWFINGKLNITENCIDRHLEKRASAPAIIWEPNDPKEPSRTITYKELHHLVNQFA